MPMSVDPAAVAGALRSGVATLDALAARLGRPPREELAWALEEGVRRGWVRPAGGAECEPDGLCGSSAPAVYSLTDAGREAARSR